MNGKDEIFGIVKQIFIDALVLNAAVLAFVAVVAIDFGSPTIR